MSGWTERYGGAALVTGASSGLGKEFARSLAERGMDLVLVARRKSALEDIAAALGGAYGVRVEVIDEDLTSEGADGRVLNRVLALQMDVGLLVNNAGFGTYGAFEQQDAGFEGQMVDLNCRAPVLLTHRFLPFMKQRGRGGVVIVASMAGFQPTPFLAVYGATKAFDLSFGEALWGELRGQGIDVVTLAPGVVNTGFQEVANSAHMPFPGQQFSARDVVEETLNGLGRRHLVTPGVLNRWLGRMSAWLPRRFNILMGVAMLRPTKDPHIKKAPLENGEFQQRALRLLLLVLMVWIVDVAVLSLWTGQIRVWFPDWFDPNWRTTVDGPITYSQSYIVGLFVLPFLVFDVDREFWASRMSLRVRAVTVGALLMVLTGCVWQVLERAWEYGTERELLGFLILTLLVGVGAYLFEHLSVSFRSFRSLRVMRVGLFGTGLFCLGVGGLEPMLRVYVHGVPWSASVWSSVGLFCALGMGLVGLSVAIKTDRV